MTVYFAPRAIATYQAVFEATVQGGGDSATKQFTCDLRGRAWRILLATLSNAL